MHHQDGGVIAATIGEGHAHKLACGRRRPALTQHFPDLLGIHVICHAITAQHINITGQYKIRQNIHFEGILGADGAQDHVLIGVALGFLARHDALRDRFLHPGVVAGQHLNLATA